MLIKYDSFNKVLVFVVNGEVKQAGSLYPVINPGRLFDPKPWHTLTKSPWVTITCDETELLISLVKMKIFRYMETPKGDTTIMIETTRTLFSGKMIQFSGYYPRYFWKGLIKVLNL